MLFVKQEIYSTTLFFLKTEAMQNTVLCCPRALRPRKPELIVLLVSWNANTLGFVLVSGVICTLQTTSDKLFLVAHVRKCSLEAVLFHRYIKNVDRFTHNVQEQGFFLQTFYIKATPHGYTKNVRSDICRARYKVHWSRVILWIVSGNQVNVQF